MCFQPRLVTKIIFKLQKNASESQCNVFSVGYEGFSFDLKNIKISDKGWHNYVLGVLNEISMLTNKVKGFDCTIESDLPLGSGLSSSAGHGVWFGL